MRVEVKKRAQKYMNERTEKDYNKIDKAIALLEDWDGDIKELEGRKNEYRLKISPYRIIFTYIKGDDQITVTKISTRGDAYKKG